MTEVVTSEEFWAQHATQYTQAQKAQTQEIGNNLITDMTNFYNTINYMNIIHY